MKKKQKRTIYTTEQKVSFLRKLGLNPEYGRVKAFVDEEALVRQTLEKWRRDERLMTLAFPNQ